MLNAATGSYTEHPPSVGGMTSASFLPAVAWDGSVQSETFVSPTVFPASTETVKRRSSRPSSLISSDSLLAVRLQQEEFWKPPKLKHPKSVPSAAVFAAHASVIHPLHSPAVATAPSKHDASAHHPRHAPAVTSGKDPLILQGKVASRPSQNAHPIVLGKRFPKLKNLNPGKRRSKFKSPAPPLSQPKKSSQKPRKAVDDWPLLMTKKSVNHESYSLTSFRENSRFFYAEVFKDEARAMRINGFPIRYEETVPLDNFDSLAIACLSGDSQRNKPHDEDIEISSILFVNDFPELSIMFDMLPHPIHASSHDIHIYMSGSTRFRTFLDCSIGQLRDFIMEKVDASDGVAKVEPHHIKITFQGLVLADDLMLQEVQVMWQAQHPSSLLQLMFYVCSPSEMWGAWQQYGQ